MNTGTTPPSTIVEKKTVDPTPLKASVEADRSSEKKSYDKERRPSFVEVSVPHANHEEHAPHHHRRHSSETHLPMSWWPEDETRATHVWVERPESGVEDDMSDADEEEDAIEEAFYASYD